MSGLQISIYSCSCFFYFVLVSNLCLRVYHRTGRVCLPSKPYNWSYRTHVKAGHSNTTICNTSTRRWQAEIESPETDRPDSLGEAAVNRRSLVLNKVEEWGAASKLVLRPPRFVPCPACLHSCTLICTHAIFKSLSQTSNLPLQL